MGQVAPLAPEQQIGRRARNRLRARLPAIVITLDGTRNTILLDLSRSGARIKATAKMALGQRAILSWSGFEAFGRLVWVDRGLCGIAFDDPLEPDVLIATRDLDAVDRLPSDLELERNRAREWVAGTRRI
jgi:PilZ domain